MKKELKKDVLNCLYLCGFVLFVVLILTRFKYEFGSKVDWETQHYEIPSYFRNLFYDTHDLFPDFAKHLGAGQNIYNFSYYGFLSPIILLSYFFPFVDMETYIQVINVLGVMLSVVLCYRWLRGYHGLKGYTKRFSINASFLATFLFACSSPLIYQAHRQIMFVNYMPFFILTLEGIDTYLARKKRALMIVSAFLVIMSSYFFSVSALIVAGIYTIGRCIDMDNLNVKAKLSVIGKTALNLFIAIFMSGILTIPTLATLLSNRGKSDNVISLKKIFLPQFYGDYLMYDAFAIGLTSILFFAIIHALYSKRAGLKFFAIILMAVSIVPVFSYVMNGMLYVEAKSLIPFLPVAIILVADLLEKLYDKEADLSLILRKSLIFAFIAIVFYNGLSIPVFILDFSVTFTTLYIYHKKGKRHYEFVIALMAVVICVVVNYNEKLLRIDSTLGEDYENIESNLKFIASQDNNGRVANDVLPLRTMNKVFNNDYYVSTMYSSVCNSLYKNFYHNEICNENPYRNDAMLKHPNNLLFDIYMGEKYLVTNDGAGVPFGYTKIYTDNGISTYENDDAFSLGYVNTKLMPRSYYNNLHYPYKSFALLYYTVVEDEVYEKYKTSDENYMAALNRYIYPAKFEIIKEGSLDIKGEKNPNSKRKSENITYRIPDSMQSMILFIKYKVDNTAYSKEAYNDFSVIGFMKYMLSSKDKVGAFKHMMSSTNNYDVIVDINNVSNKLTFLGWKYYNKNTEFCYCLSDDRFINKINYKFYDGKYVLTDFSAYRMNYVILKDIKRRLYDLELENDKSPNVIKGRIKNDEDGFFTLSVPYDKGFTCYVDGKKTAIEKVDTAFMGVFLEKGEHDIRFEYHAPMKNAGIALSILGFVLFAFSVGYFDVYSKKNL